MWKMKPPGRQRIERSMFGKIWKGYTMKEEMANIKKGAFVTNLPNARHYQGEIVVVKFGGSAMCDENISKKIMEDITSLQQMGIKMVLVHGGGPHISACLKKMGKDSVFVDGIRMTDDETMDVVQMVLSGKVNKKLVSQIRKCGGSAIGISGVDGGLLTAEKMAKNMGCTGVIKSVCKDVICDLLKAGYLPVISPVASDENGCIYNINGDMAAAKIAAELHAKRLIFLTDIDGVQIDQKEKSSLQKKLSPHKVKELCKSKIISGGMLPKVNCALDALSSGVGEVSITRGNRAHALIYELKMGESLGTLFVEKVGE